MGRAVHPHFITPDSADGGDIITGSTRFRKEDTFQFFRTPSSANNQYRYTISAWVKKTRINDGTGFGLMNSNSVVQEVLLDSVDLVVVEQQRMMILVVVIVMHLQDLVITI